MQADHQARPPSPPPMSALTPIQRVEQILAEIGDPSHAESNARTPLMEVAARWLNKEEAVEMAECLLQHGADLNAVDKDGNTALILAAKANNLPLVMYLVEYGADTGARNHVGDTAWSWAVRRDSTAMMQYLRWRGAGPDEHESSIV